MTFDELMASLYGAVIIGGEKTEYGIHIYLQDGRILVLPGYMDACEGVLESVH